MHPRRRRFTFRSLPLLVGMALAPVACEATGPDRRVEVRGETWRGPTQPVCRVDELCDAPFSAGFTVQRARRLVARFRSDAQGRFELRLAPGRYDVVPDADAPLLAPTSQRRALVVPDTGVRGVRLDFDTGIR